MKAFWPIAVITFKEGVRNRALYGILILALLMFGATLLLSGMIMQGVGKVAVELSLSAVSFAGLLLVLFVGINLVAKDLDRRTIYMVLSRPISRSQYVVGKYSGICLLILLATAVLGLFALSSVALVKLAYPFYFARFTWLLVVQAICLTAFKLMLLAAISMLFASFTSTSFITFVLTIVSYLIGESIAGIKALVEASDVVGISVSAATKKLVAFVYYAFPNLSLFDIKEQAAHGLIVSPQYFFGVIGYACLYSLVAVLLGSLVFSRREFP